MQELYAITGMVYEDVYIAVAGSLHHAVVLIPLRVWKLLHVSVEAVIQQITHTVIKAELAAGLDDCKQFLVVYLTANERTTASVRISISFNSPGGISGLLCFRWLYQ